MPGVSAAAWPNSAPLQNSAKLTNTKRNHQQIHVCSLTRWQTPNRDKIQILPDPRDRCPSSSISAGTDSNSLHDESCQHICITCPTWLAPTSMSAILYP